ncbi:MAG: tetratricopeptide repeat protein [Prevotella sp.]|nr:tetratricopeptide repeat protein [Prevotella sp.]
MKMKRFMMWALMAATATTTFAQEATVKEAKKLLGKSDFDAAAKMLAPALTSNETLDKAAAWNLQSEIMYNKYTTISAKQMENQVKKIDESTDTMGMYKAAVAAWEAVLKCDEFDQLPDAKGKVKMKYRSPAQTKYKNFGVTLVQAGQFFYQKKDNKNAIDAWKKYLEMKQTSIFKEVADFPKDSFYDDIVYYVAFLAYQEKDYPNAVKYASQLAAVPGKEDEANEILLFAKRETLKSKADSLEYVDMVKKIHRANPESERYFNLLVEYYNSVSPAEKLAWVEEEISVAPQNKMPWAIKGEAMMNSDKWDEAVAAFKKAIEIDPDWVPCLFNTGICLNSKAIALNDQLMDKKTMALTNENAEKVKNVLREALIYLEKTRELDPDQLQTKWGYPLYRIYYSLGNKEKMAELEAIDPTLKN